MQWLSVISIFVSRASRDLLQTQRDPKLSHQKATKDTSASGCHAANSSKENPPFGLKKLIIYNETKRWHPASFLQHCCRFWNRGALVKFQQKGFHNSLPSRFCAVHLARLRVWRSRRYICENRFGYFSDYRYKLKGDRFLRKTCRQWPETEYATNVLDIFSQITWKRTGSYVIIAANFFILKCFFLQGRFNSICF